MEIYAQKRLKWEMKKDASTAALLYDIPHVTRLLNDSVDSIRRDFADVTCALADITRAKETADEALLQHLQQDAALRLQQQHDRDTLLQQHEVETNKLQQALDNECALLQQHTQLLQQHKAEANKVQETLDSERALLLQHTELLQQHKAETNKVQHILESERDDARLKNDAFEVRCEMSHELHILNGTRTICTTEDSEKRAR